MNKLLISFALVIFVIIASFWGFNQYIYHQKQSDDTINVQAYRGTLSGEYVCLPHKNQQDPQTLECAFGLKTDADEYYAVDFSLMSQESPNLIIGDRFTATGRITPIQLLSTDAWQAYPIEGIFSVTNSVEKL